jgi:BirA family biotin operon repressor/biotin-[acetyl-CoA-carboxylase] ligase
VKSTCRAGFSLPEHEPDPGQRQAEACPTRLGLGPFVATLIVREELGSTSELARELVLSGTPALPMAVRARRQTRGRGRGSNTWWSDAGSLTVTLAFDPAAYRLSPVHEPRLALVLAVGLIEAIEAQGSLQHPLGIRWPNDVEAGGRKLAGILPERVVTPAGPRLLIGIGVNVATRLDAAPAAVRRMATTLHELVVGPAIAPGPDDLLRSLLERVPPMLDRFAEDDPALAARWGELDTLLGQPLRVKLPDRLVEGTGRGIDAQGALLVATTTGVEQLIGGQVLRVP